MPTDVTFVPVALSWSQDDASHTFERSDDEHFAVIERGVIRGREWVTWIALHHTTIYNGLPNRPACWAISIGTTAGLTDKQLAEEGGVMRYLHKMAPDATLEQAKETAATVVAAGVKP